jgi:hypothetical protein
MGLSSAMRPPGSLVMKKQLPCEVYHVEAFHRVARGIICVKEAECVSCLGSRALPRRGIVNMNHLLFLVEVPNNDVYRMNS